MNLRAVKNVLGRFRHYSTRQKLFDLSSPNLTISSLIVALVLGLTVLSLAWLANRATRLWRATATLVVERRVDETAALLVTALVRDMRGVQETILMPLATEHLDLDAPYEITDRVARAFARFPYPESFFVWKPSPDASVLFNRADRPPEWAKTNGTPAAFPVALFRDSPEPGQLADLAANHVSPGEEVAVFETTIAGIPYQVITRVFYHGIQRSEIFAIVGFTVNLNWVEAEYFSEITDQIERMAGTTSAAGAYSLSIVDQEGKLVTQTQKSNGDGPFTEVEFPLAFFDSLSTPGITLGSDPVQRWIARAAVADDPLLAAATTGASRTLALILFAILASAVSLLLAIRLWRANFDLVATKANFVQMMGHELKTPLTSIRLIGETLSAGRFVSERSSMEYGALVSKEAARLSRLIENVLTVASIVDSKSVYKMTNVDLGELVTETLTMLQPQIDEGHFDLGVEVPGSLPEVRCDREAIVSALENFIVNAFKYSDHYGKITIRVVHDSRYARVSVRDEGRGIAPEDLPSVFDKFFRGKNAGFGGSGLGLAIADKILKDHGGSISIESTRGVGTTVTLNLPRDSS